MTTTTRVYTHTYTHMRMRMRAYIHARASKQERKTHKRKQVAKTLRFENSKALSLCPLVHRLPVRIHVPDTKLHRTSVWDGSWQLRNKT